MIRISSLIRGKDLEQWKIVRPFRARLSKWGMDHSRISNEWILKCVATNNLFDYHVPVLKFPVPDFSIGEYFNKGRQFDAGYHRPMIVSSTNHIICTTQS